MQPNNLTHIQSIRNDTSTTCYRIFSPKPNASKRLFILPHASGSASYFRQWHELVDADVEVVVIQYPGRENRISKPLINDMSQLVTTLAVGLRPLLNKPFVIFGHSMGGAVAYELTLKIQSYRYREPCHLVISAIEGPSCHHQGELYRASDEQLLAELTRLNGTQVDFNQYPELADMVLPLMRNDYQLIETYQPDLNAAKIACPVTVMAAEQDTELTIAEAQTWQQVCASSFTIKTYPGDHFYISSQASNVTKYICNLYPNNQNWLCAP
ncbi:alpha/beta fold hydrolase [Pseudoalteromonas tunicata]|uniref:thioesterase II family protein n=1 Tax=Pseudoalteromonas tunicata TaxID=314281 RepID=UPI00273E400A|nr:alpha/beta fold hydrolase [Pseudoalteromonas tunicata]MDP5213364.1 alpha/beta fold hydrolase [Pseudoalteromonas tunicata]